MKFGMTSIVFFALVGCAVTPDIRLSAEQRQRCESVYDWNDPDGDGEFLIHRAINSGCLEYGKIRTFEGMLSWTVNEDGTDVTLLLEGGPSALVPFYDRRTSWLIADDNELPVAKPVAGCAAIMTITFAGRRAVSHVPSFKFDNNYIKVERVLRHGPPRHLNAYRNGKPVARCAD